MIKSRFIWGVSATLILGLTILITVNDRSVNLVPSYQTSTMKDLYLKHRESGTIKWELTSERAVMPEGKKEIQLESLALKIVRDPEIILTSGIGLYEVETGDITLTDAVELNVKDATFHTSSLKWHSKEETIDTDAEVNLKGSNFLITGSGLLARVKHEQVRILNDVEAIYYR
jgi:LPS export ABC transporter protein LptC